MAEKFGIVTGASRGLGVAMARELAREGYNVVITYQNNKEKAEAVAEELSEEFNVQVIPCQCDTEDEVSAKKLIEFSVKTFGEKLEVLVNNAGVYRNQSVVDMEPSEYAKVVNINMMGVYNVSYYAIPYMIKQHYGRIIHLSSAVGLRGMPGCSAYASSKFGVRGLTQAMACDLGQYNITVNAIAPGAHVTDMLKSAPEEAMKARLASTPLGRFGELTEMELLIRYFIASDFTTGQVVSPNGGTTMV